MHRLPDLAIAEDTAVSVPPADLDASQVETVCDENGVVWALVWERGTTRFVHLPDVGTFALAPQATEVVATVRPDTPHESIVETYERFIAPIIRLVSGDEVLHASAVLTPSGVVAFCGDPDAGKSTLAYGLSLRGFEHWADDSVAVDLSDSRPRSIRLRTAPNLSQPSTAFFDTVPTPRATAVTAATESLAPLRAILVLRRKEDPEPGRATRISRLRGGRAFDAIVQHAFRLRLHREDERRRRLVENYMALTASVPVYILELSWGFDRLPAVLHELAEWLSHRRTT
jgi:hypothetical protein